MSKSFFKSLSLSVVMALNVFLFSCGEKTSKTKVIELPVVKMRKMSPMLGVHVGDLTTITNVPEFKGQKGLNIYKIQMDTIASEAGILPGDIILEYDQNSFSNVGAEEAPAKFRNYIQDQKNVGDPFYLKILRTETLFSGTKGSERLSELPYKAEEITNLINEQKPGESLDLSIQKEASIIEMTLELGPRPNYLTEPPLKNEALLPQYETYSDAYLSLTKKLIEHYGLKKDFDDLMDRYEEDEWWDDGFRLNAIRYVHRDPVKLPRVSKDMTDKLEATLHAKHQDFKTLNTVLSGFLDLDETQVKPKDINAPTGRDVKKHFQFIEQVIRQAQEYREIAFSEFSKDDLDFLYGSLSQLTGRYINGSWDSNSSAEDYDQFQRLIKLSHKINYASLARAQATLTELANPKWLDSFYQSLVKYNPTAGEKDAKGKASGDVFMVYHSEVGDIVVGGAEKTSYAGDLAFIIDLGGNDFYRNNAGAARSKDTPVSFLIDFSGDDQYSDTDSVSQGSGFLGCGLLIDRAGDDLYMAIQLAQGTGIFGMGMLIDETGNDQYNGQEYTQGAAFWGTGAVIDMAGSDEYRAHYFSQGLGGPKAVGLVFDIDGDDFYYATGKYQSSYGTRGIFGGMSQGFGFGLRLYASGGIGILLDSKGADQFYAGNFSQGGGYFYGMGVIKNSGSDHDEYYGSHYNQGFSAHSAAGILIDDGGDDKYEGRITAVQGAAWDLGVAALIDKGGDDLYDDLGMGFSQGAAEHNGFGLFIDMAGRDTYKLNAKAREAAQSNNYHGGASLAFFIDNGAEKDFYDVDELRNNLIEHSGRHSFFVDLGQDIENVLRNDTFQKLIKTREE